MDPFVLRSKLSSFLFDSLQKTTYIKRQKTIPSSPNPPLLYADEHAVLFQSFGPARYPRSTGGLDSSRGRLVVVRWIGEQ